MQLLVDTLAREFCEDLDTCLPEEQVKAIGERNRVGTALGACYSHDFCNANMVLYDALRDQAWSLGKARGIRVGDRPAPRRSLTARAGRS